MENKNLADHLPLSERAVFLSDNCDKIEQMSYLKKFTEEEIVEMKDRVSAVSIEINVLKLKRNLRLLNSAVSLSPWLKNEILSSPTSKAKLS